MRIAILLLAPSLGLAACNDEPSKEQQEIRDQADVAAVEALQKAPPKPIDPDPIRYPDIEKNKLYGASCAFAPEGGGLGAIALAMADAGYMKIDGAIQRFAPDPGSKEQPLGTRAKYDGRSYSFTLALGAGEGRQSGYETSDFSATLTVRNSGDEVVYQSEGIAQCGV